MYLPEWSPLPVATRDGEKVLLVKGVSGGSERYADAQDVNGWIDQPRLASAGIALRLPKNVIGIDVDCYGDKAGRRTFAALQSKWGALDRTWITTSRVDGSGIRLFRIPDEAIPFVDQMRDPRGQFANGDPLGGIEIIRWRHRYATVWPTWHGGVDAMYQWRYPDGSVSVEELPVPEDLPHLKAAWITGLASAPESYLNSGNSSEPLAAGDWFENRPDAYGEMCEAMKRDLGRYAAEVTDAGKTGGCYPAACRGLLALVGNAAEGHRGGGTAVEELWQSYRRAMASRKTGRRPANAISDEFIRALNGATQKMPRSKFRNEDLCEWELP